MRWIKKGFFYVASGTYSYGVAPSVLTLDSKNIRIYFSPRDKNNCSHITWIDADISEDLWEITGEAREPVVYPGEIGTFDESGATNSCMVNTKKAIYLYYTGWNLGLTVPFRFSIGLAVSYDKGLTFNKISSGPVMDRNTVDPYMIASPFVLSIEDYWHMWYVSGVRWENLRKRLKPYCHIRYACSKDGINWERNGNICIDFKNKLEYYFARPSVVLENGLYKMWYCYRASEKGETFRIGYAESIDGLIWERKDDDTGIDVSEEGWDSEMICYPYVFKHKGNFYMLYNGNGYGKTGFGCAILEQ